MFEPQDTPRIFAQEPGVDFPRAVVNGLRARLAGQPPEAMARVTLFVNTSRMGRRIEALFSEGPACFLPRIRLITDLGADLATDGAALDLPTAMSSLRRNLELAKLIARLLESQPDLAPQHATYALAESLAGLFDEMRGEGVGIDRLADLDVADHSRYWARSLAFIELANRFVGTMEDGFLDAATRQRRVVEALVSHWTDKPPKDPVIVAGSTGSRGTTALFMRCVAALPQGAVILPGFDFDLPASVWDNPESDMSAEDHPQYRFRRLLSSLEMSWSDVAPWHATEPASRRRNALLSLALRPAPVTDVWQSEGPRFADVGEATKGVTLIEAPTPRDQANAIALILREAAERGQSAALISPDRTLTRQVTAALDRWRIVPDDSAGRPLPLTAPGRLLRHVAEMRGAQIDGVALLTLLKHPLTHTGAERGEHLRLTRELELGALRRSMPFPDRATLGTWAGKDDLKQRWAQWIGGLIEALAAARRADLADHVAQTITIAERLAAGSHSDDPAELWDREAGRVARTMLGDLQAEAEHGGEMSAGEFRDLFTSFLNGGDVRETTESHPGVMIWGTLEARVQGVDLVILGGLQDGTWPQTISPDPWMNRAMRKQAGLLLPERQIGLSAHDFQMAFGTREAILTRALRDDESETVPSRWINRLTNLMSGMSNAGRAALDDMRDRGKVWLDRVQDLEAPEREVPRAIRPAPMPPVHHRPNRLSFTQVGRLVRDPYAIYAQKILRLSPIDPLHKRPDAPLRGTILHDIFERFVRHRVENEPGDIARERLLTIARDVLESDLPWPAARILWLAKIARNADWFLDGEAERQAQATDILTELQGEASFFDPPFTLHGRADRMDVRADGRVALFDYKTGQIPTKDQQRAYDKQLLLEALVLKVGGFDKLGRSETAEVAYIGLGSNPKVSSVEVEPGLLLDVEKEFEALIRSFRQPSRGYVSRRVMFSAGDGTGDFDHLARYGEWDHAEDPTPEPVGDHDG